MLNMSLLTAYARFMEHIVRCMEVSLYRDKH